MSVTFVTSFIGKPLKDYLVILILSMLTNKEKKQWMTYSFYVIQCQCDVIHWSDFGIGYRKYLKGFERYIEFLKMP